jgi:hypothetical protein
MTCVVSTMYTCGWHNSAIVPPEVNTALMSMPQGGVLSRHIMPRLHGHNANIVRRYWPLDNAGVDRQWAQHAGMNGSVHLRVQCLLFENVLRLPFILTRIQPTG